MSIEELSNEFDFLLNSYGDRNNKITLDEYEKSLLLTEAQSQLVKSIYSGAVGESFEGTEEMRRYLDEVVVEDTPKRISSKSKNNYIYSTYRLDPDTWFIVYESAELSSNPFCSEKEGSMELKVIPVRHDEWNIVKDNPFKKPNNRRILRLEYSDGSRVVELISKFEIDKYIIRYIKQPKPIILYDLAGSNLTIDGQSTESTCQLNLALHRPILELAVQLAKKKYASNV